MKFFQRSLLIPLAFLAITCGYFSFAEADTTEINPILDNLFAEWLKKQAAAEATTEAPTVQNAAAPETQTPVNAPEETAPAAQQPVQSVNPFLPQFAPYPFLPQVPPNPFLPPGPLNPYLDPAVNPLAAYYPYMSPFGPFPLKIKKKKV